MAAPANARAQIHQKWFELNPPIPDQNLDIVTQVLDEAINAIWDWVSSREGQLANGLPQPFRGRTSRNEKYLLLTIMAWTQAEQYVDLLPPTVEEAE